MSQPKAEDMHTPKVKKLPQITTSTVDKTKSQKRDLRNDVNTSIDSSLSILSLNNVDLSNIADIPEYSSIDQVMRRQRELASNTLNRAARVSAIPSKLLKAELSQTRSESNYNFNMESTVNESDLIQTPKDTSTPRSSSAELGDLVSPAPRESIFSRARDMLNKDISTHNVLQEFTSANKMSSSLTSVASDLFVPAEEAALKLMADEISWKQKHDFPVAPNCNSFQDNGDLPSISIGEFFQQGSDNLSELRAKSPTTQAPVALIDSTNFSNVSRNSTVDESFEPKSLNFDAIQQLLVDNTPIKVLDYLMKQNKKPLGRKSTLRESSDIDSLPVSRDVSSTTFFSDNEAIKGVVAKEDKENFRPSSRNITTAQPMNNIIMSSPPPRTSSSLTSLPNGKLPIESTVSELVWGCVKVDRCVTKQFMLRNKTPKTLRLQCSVSTYEFKIRKDARLDSDYLSACKFVLHGHESRLLIISFIPTKVGAAVDELVFAPLDTNLEQTKKQCVRLFGYGGYSNVEFQNASRDNTGKYWLSLGRMDNRLVLEQQFTVKNTGNLLSFTCIKVIPKHIITFSSLKIEPNFFVLLPNAEKTIKITYRPNAKDCRVLKQNFDVLAVIDIGKLEIISGTEVNRARLKRLHRKSSEKGLNVNELARLLSQKINGEVYPSDVGKLKESPNAVNDILETLANEEMIITIEQDPNQTVVEEYPEDSVMYQTLGGQVTLLDETIVHKKSCRLEPPSIVLVPPTKLKDRLFLISECEKTLHFEVTCNPIGLHVSPTDGAIAPNKTVEFMVRLQHHLTNTTFKILVYVDNESFEVEVRVLNASRSSRRSFLD